MIEIKGDVETWRQIKDAACADAAAEIDRLRKALERTRPHVRNEIIEECARVAKIIEDEAGTILGIAAAIRALKDKR